eukprot:351032-Chlamydomonas_euryale.AAC.4
MLMCDTGAVARRRRRRARRWPCERRGPSVLPQGGRHGGCGAWGVECWLWPVRHDVQAVCQVLCGIASARCCKCGLFVCAWFATWVGLKGCTVSTPLAGDQASPGVKTSTGQAEQW